jgi:GPH family glycoside/pentoside/hexuronide:cation symporter
MLSEISAVAAKESGKSLEGVFFGIQGFFLKMAFMLSIAILPIVLLLGSGVSLADSIVKRPEGVAITGVYATTLVAMGCFVLAALLYYLYPEKIVHEE